MNSCIFSDCFGLAELQSPGEKNDNLLSLCVRALYKEQPLASPGLLKKQIYSFVKIFVDIFKANIFGYSFNTFFPHEYIWTFIQIVRFQQIYLMGFAQQNNSYYATNGTFFLQSKS